MALQSQSSNPLTDFGALLRRRIWNIILPFAFVSALGVMVAQLMPRQYTVQTTVKLPEVTTPGTGSAIQRDVNSARNDLVAEPLVRSVIEAQEWPDFIGLTEKEKVEYVRRVIFNTKPQVSSGKNFTGSSYITVRYTDSEGSRAERYLNMLRDRYIDGVVRGVRNAAKTTVAMMKELRAQHLSAYQQAEKQRATLAKQYNLSAPQNGPGGGQGRGDDPIYSRLVQSNQQLDQATTELKAKQAQLDFTRALYDQEPDSIPESEAMAALAAAAGGKPVVPVNDAENKARDMELQIFDLRESLKDYRPLHSKYTLIGEEISDLESKIAMLRGESAQTAISPRSTRWVPNPKRNYYEQEIRILGTTIAGLDKTVSTLTSSIAELSQLHEQRQEVYLQLNILDQEVNRANETYLNTDNFYQNQVTRLQLLEGPEANPFEVVEVAKDDGIPSAPNVLMWIAGSALLGLALGLGSALASEFLRNGFRSITDLTRGLATPVLGSVNLIITREQARRAWTRHVMIAASSAVIVGAVLWVTWAAQHDSLRLLGPRLTQVIDDVRMAFRP